MKAAKSTASPPAHGQTALKNKEIDKMAPLDDKEAQQILTSADQAAQRVRRAVHQGRTPEMVTRKPPKSSLIETYLRKKPGGRDRGRSAGSACRDDWASHNEGHGHSDEGHMAISPPPGASGWEGGQRGGKEGVGGETVKPNAS